jgi:DnaJ family protein C protein 9
MSLKTHPDRCPADEKERATQDFQAIGRAYLILSTPKLRNIYDNTGRIVDDEELPYATQEGGDSEEINWSTWFRDLFERVSFETLDQVKQSYQGSEEEKQDLLKFYELYQGDMDAILSCVIFSTLEDEPRFRKMLKSAVNDGLIPDYPALSDEPEKKIANRRKKYQKEAKEASEYKKALQQARRGDSKGLVSAIAIRQKDRQEELLNKIMSKYVKPSKGNKKSSPISRRHKLHSQDPMTDAEFNALDERLWGNVPRPKL